MPRASAIRSRHDARRYQNPAEPCRVSRRRPGGRKFTQIRKSLTDAREDRIGHDAEHRAEKGASREEVRQKPADMGCQFLRCLATVAVRQCRNPGGVPLYAQQQDAHAQEDGADSEVDAELTLRAGLDRSQWVALGLERE